MATSEEDGIVSPAEWGYDLSLPIVYHCPPSQRKKNSDRVLDLRLEQAREDEICPITQELIRESISPLQADDDPKLFFDPSNPAFDCLHIALCGHRFSAVNLVYHWVRNHTVKCPVCRQGPASARLKRNCIPQHLRSVLAARVKVEQDNDDAERMADDLREAERLERLFGSAPVSSAVSGTVEMAPASLGNTQWGVSFSVNSTFGPMTRFEALVHPWCMERLGDCCIEVRSGTDTVHVFRGLSSIMYAQRITFQVDVDIPYQSCVLLGGVNHLRFPASRILEPGERGLVNLSLPRRATNYWMVVGEEDGRIKQLNFEVMIDLFCVLALEQDQLRVMELFAGAL